MARHGTQVLERMHSTTVPTASANRCWGADHCCRYDRGVTVKLSDELSLAPLGSTPRPLGEWLTTFHLATVVLDPYTNESSWVLRSAVRILEALRGCHARVNLLVTADEADTRRFLGPLADQFLVFTDPDRAVVSDMGLTALPAFVFVRVDGTVDATAQGWNPAEWRAVADAITNTTAWRSPTIPEAGDPAPFAGSPAIA